MVLTAFVTHARGADGDPLDGLILMDQASYLGTLVECRISVILEAEQTERNDETFRNDMIFAAALVCERKFGITSVKRLTRILLNELTEFFITYNSIAGKKFQLLGYKGMRTAMRLTKN